MTRISFLVALCVSASPALASVVHDVPGDFSTLTSALPAASPTDTGRVAPGTFSPSANGESFPLSVPDDIVLIGSGWPTTTLDAEGTAGVMVLSGGGAARVSGFTLTGGIATNGGGIDITAGTHEVDSLLVIDCGALLRGSAINVAGDAAPNVHHNILWECFDTDLDHGGDPHVAHWGGTAAGTFAQNLVGRGDSNGLFVLEGAAPEVRHNIFIENGIEGVRGRGTCFAGDPATVIAYNLYWSNSVASLIMRDDQGNFVNMDAATANSVSASDGVYGNFDADPLLVDPASFDFSLAPTSPAINAGEPGTGTDPDGTIFDLGPIYHPLAATGAPTPEPLRAASIGGARPNPFNPRTQIEVELAWGGFAAVTIHDVRGRQVRSLFAGTADAGSFTVNFDGLDDRGRPLASGVYFARLAALGEIDTSSMVLLR
jgi:hypothetical protein